MRELQIDLGRIVANYRVLVQTAAPAQVMAVVKANAYGHGIVEVARALDAAGVHFLGVADSEEALQLRTAGIESRLLCWFIESQAAMVQCAESGIDVGISTMQQLEWVAKAHALTGIKPRVHVKVDTGLGRNGFSPLDWGRAFDWISEHRVQFELVGIFSHLSNTSEADDRKQQAEFERAIAEAGRRSLSFQLRHLAASGATLSYPEMRYDMVRCGIAVYGLTPDNRPISPYGLKPAMRAVARIANLKRVPAGQSVSYGYLYTTDKPTILALVPFGYAEGMPRIARGVRVAIGGQQFSVVGRIAMDQFVVDVGDTRLEIGDEVVIFGDLQRGEPRVEDLAYAAQTINYEVVTRVGGRAKRVFHGG